MLIILVKWAIAGSMFIYPCGWAWTMSHVVVHLQIYVPWHCHINWLNVQQPFPSPSSTATNHVTQWRWRWWRLLFTTQDTLCLAIQTTTMTTTPTFQITISDHLHDSSKFFILFYIFSTNDYFPRLCTTYFLDAGTNHESTENRRGMKHVRCVSTLGIFILFLIFSSANIFNL